MKSRCSSAKMTQRRPFLRMLATVLSVVLLITSLGIGSIISTNAYDLNDATMLQLVILQDSDNTGLVNGQDLSSNRFIVLTQNSSNAQNWYGEAVFKTNTGDGNWGYKTKVLKSIGAAEYWVSHADNEYGMYMNTECWLHAQEDKSADRLYVPGNSTTGYRKVNIYADGQNGTGYFKLYFTSGDGDKIATFTATSYTNSEETVKAGAIVNVDPESKTGGSGTWDVSYTVSRGGVNLTASDYISDNKFQTFVPGDYTIVATVKDKYCPTFVTHTATKTLHVNSADWHIYGLKDYGAKVLSDTNKLTSNGDGTFYIDVNLDHYTSGDDGTTNGKFGLKNEDGVVFGPDASGDYVINEKYLSKPISMKPNSGYFFKFTVENTACQWTRSCRITLDTNNHTLTVAPTDIVVIAKDGASRSTTNSASSKWNYGVIADTTIEALDGALRSSWTAETEYKTCDIATSTVNSVSKTASFETIKTAPGSTISIKTTVDSAYKSKYMVKAFNINGKAVPPTTSDESSGVYTLDNYTIKGTITAPFLEITPIYYLTNTYKTTNNIETVTYYMEGFDSTIQNLWGDTIYAYPFYGTLGDTSNTFGAYPGQPFVNIDGKYGIEIPVNKNVPVGTDDPGSTLIKGVTVNCGSFDYVHNLINGFSHDYQTYDSDGFYKIYTEKAEQNPTNNLSEKPNNIIQTFKYRNTTNNRNTYGGQENDIWGYDVNEDVVTSYTASTTKTTSQWISEVESGNGWELYTDRFGRPIDIFGNHITPLGASEIQTSYDDSYELENPALRVISSGYVANISGDYGTGWLVYKPNGDGTEYTLEYDSVNKIYSIPPSVFILKDSASFSSYTANDISNRKAENFTYSDSISNYSTMYSNLKTNFANRYVYISYEKNAPIHSGTGAYRMDTKWEYTYSFDTAHANILIEYSDDGSTWNVDSMVSGYNGFNNLGNTSGCYAYFTNTNLVGSVQNVEGNITSTQVASSTSTYNFTAVPGTGKMLVGWYIKDGTSYTPIDTDGKAYGSTPVTGNETLVARFMDVADGSLTISHNPTVNNEKFGDTKIQVTVYNGSTKLYDSGSEGSSVTLDSAYISNTHSTYDINVTLITNPTSANTTFDCETGYVYDGFNTSQSISATEADNQSSFSFKVAKLYNALLTNQDTNSLFYTSTFTVLPTYTYNYIDREGESQQCIAVGTVAMTEEEKASGLSTSTTGDRATDITAVLSNLGITSFKKNTVVNTIARGSATNLIVGPIFGDKTLTLTYYYPTAGSDSTGVPITIPGSDTSKTVYRANTYQTGSVTGAYGTRVNLYNTVHSCALAGKEFYAWCEYTPGANDTFGTIGKVVSTEENFNYAVAKDQTIIAVYADSAYSVDEAAQDHWDSYVDDNEVTLSKRTAETDGTYYNDSLVRFANYKTNGSVKDLTNGSATVEYGILIVYRTAEDVTSASAGGKYTIDQIKVNKTFLDACVSGLDNYKVGRNSSQLVNATKIVVDNDHLSNLNRADVVLKSSYSKFHGAEYAVVAYLREGNGTIHYSSTATKNY